MIGRGDSEGGDGLMTWKVYCFVDLLFCYMEDVVRNG